MELLVNLIKSSLLNTRVSGLFHVVEDILVCLERVEDRDYETNQSTIGMRNLFNSFSAKVKKKL